MHRDDFLLSSLETGDIVSAEGAGKTAVSRAVKKRSSNKAVRAG